MSDQIPIHIRNWGTLPIYNIYVKMGIEFILKVNLNTVFNRLGWMCWLCRSFMLRFDSAHETLRCEIGCRETASSAENRRCHRDSNRQERNWQAFQTRRQNNHSLFRKTRRRWDQRDRETYQRNCWVSTKFFKNNLKQ